MRNKSEILGSPSQIRSRRAGTVVAALASGVIGSMAAASSAQAQSAAAGLVVIQRTGGGGGGVDKAARASAEAAMRGVEAALKRLEVAEANVAATLKVATATADALKAATEKLAELEGVLAELHAKRKRAVSPPPTDDKKGGGSKGSESGEPGTRPPPPADAAPPVGDTTGTTGGETDSDVSKGEASPPPPPEPRLPTAAEIQAAKAIIVARAAVAEARALQARLENDARKAHVKLLEAQHKRAEAQAELARAQADEKAARLAEAQAQAEAAKAKSDGLDAAAKATRDSLAEAMRQAEEARTKLTAANADAAKARGDLAAYNSAIGPGPLPGGTRPTYSPVDYGEDPRPQFFGEIAVHAGMNSGNDFRGGAEMAAFARLAEHVAVGARGGVGGGSRMIHMGENQRVAGTSSETKILGAVQLGTIGGQDGANVELGLGVGKDSQIGVANGPDGSKREGAVSHSPRLEVAPAYYFLVSPVVRVKVAFTLSFTGGRPTQLGAAERENAVGLDFGFGLSTK